jgi:hypothetical protein
LGKEQSKVHLACYSLTIYRKSFTDLRNLIGAESKRLKKINFHAHSIKEKVKKKKFIGAGTSPYQRRKAQAIYNKLRLLQEKQTKNYF